MLFAIYVVCLFSILDTSFFDKSADTNVKVFSKYETKYFIF